MRWTWLTMALLTACPKGGAGGADLPPALEMDVLGDLWPALCVSTVPEAGRPPKSDRAALQTALDKLALQKPAEATSALSTSLPSPAVSSVRAMADLLQGNTNAALPQLDELVEAWPNDACLLRGAALARHLGRSPGGLELAQKAMAADPGHPDAPLLVAILSLVSGDVQGANTMLAQAVVQHPDNARLHHARGVVLLDTGDPKDAIAVLQRAAELGADVAELLEDAAFQAGDVSAYLRAMAARGAPLPPGVGEAADPAKALRAALGLGDGDPVVHLDTSGGRLSCVLHPDKAPLTVAVFAGLGTGKLAWTDPTSGAVQERPLYPGTVFHRAIPGFMLQGGDPLGTGTGGPGFRFRDEVSPSDSFDRPGLLAMANAGPGTNGSQFFITEAPTPWLAGRHTIFGTCDATTIERVKAINAGPRGPGDRPETPVTLDAFTIDPVGKLDLSLAPPAPPAEPEAAPAPPAP